MCYIVFGRGFIVFLKLGTQNDNRRVERTIVKYCLTIPTVLQIF